MTKLIAQETLHGNGQKVERWTLQTKAPTQYVARQKVRAYVRGQDFTIKNILRPEVTSSESRQATFSDVVPDTFERKLHKVELVVVR